MVHKFFQFRFNEITIEQLTTSHFFSPKVLLGFRTLFTIWTLIVLITGLAYRPQGWGFFLTNLSYLSLTLYLCGMFVISVLHLRGKSIHPVAMGILTVVYETLLTAHVIVPFVYWLFLSAGFAERIVFSQWLGISVHGMDFVVMFAEFMMCRLQMFPIHMIFMVCVCWLYIFYTMIIFATNGFWVYPFLDWAHMIVVGYYFGFTIAVCILHLGWWGLTLLKNKLTHYDPNGSNLTALASKSDVEMGGAPNS